MKRIVIALLILIFVYLFNLKSKVLSIKSPIKLAYLYDGIMDESIDVDYIENKYYLTCVEDGVINYIGYNDKYKDYIIVSSKNTDYLYYNLEKIDLYLYKYLKKNDIISPIENTGVIKL